MPLVLGLFRVSDDIYDYSRGIFYTILPNGILNPLPKQAKYISSGINRGVFKTEEEAKTCMLNDIKNDIFKNDPGLYKFNEDGSVFLVETDKTNYFYVIDKYQAEDDIYFRISDPPMRIEQYIIKNNEFIKKTPI